MYYYRLVEKKVQKTFFFVDRPLHPTPLLVVGQRKNGTFFAASLNISKMAKQYRSLLFTALDEKHFLKGWKYKKNYIYLAKMKEKKALLFYSTIYRKMREGKFWFC